MTAAIDQYTQINVHGGVADANAHKLIQMLFTGVLEKISAAKGCMGRGDVKGKGENLSIAISILDGLQASLDLEKGGEIANNLFRLYQYMMEKILVANMEDDTAILDEVTKLLLTIKTAWDAIEGEANQILEKE